MAPAAPPGALAGYNFRGTGDEVLGHVNVKRRGVLLWASSGGTFTVVADSGRLRLHSNARRGRVALARGIYSGIHVHATGTWVLEFRY